MTNNKVSDAHRGLNKLKQLDVPPRLLLGPGPSNLPARVNSALSTPMIGYADPAFFSILDETCGLLRYLFQTENEFTIPISGAGSSAMETCLANIIEPGDVVVVLVSGYFSERIYEMAGRYGADRRRVEKTWGTSCFSLDEIKAALEQHKPKLLALVHGETSTGIKQEMEGIGALCHSHNSLLMVDTVASLGSVPFFVDSWEIDACYTGGQKCISGPPGISPLTFSPLAMTKIRGRKSPVANWYLDATLLSDYWIPPTPGSGGVRKYHHTPPTNLIYALREAVLLVAEEGLENVWKRHQEATDALYAGLKEQGLAPFVQDPQMRLPSLTTISVPEGVDHAEVASYLLNNHNIEIAKGLGPLLGKVWRVGLMGHNSRVRNVKHLLAALKEAVQYSREKKTNSSL